MGEAAWRKRFRAAQISRPGWARDNPERLLYVSNSSGKWEVYTWDRKADAHRQFTDRPEGSYLAELDPDGDFVWWFNDEKGNELGRWLIQPFEGDKEPAETAVQPAYDAGLDVASSFAVVGSSTEEGSVIQLVREGKEPARLYSHQEHALVGGLSRDESLLCIVHSEHGDSLHPALRVVAIDGGEVVGDLWDGPGLGLRPAGWSKVPGDQRLLVIHERKGLPRPLIWNLEIGDVQEAELDLPGEISATWYPDASALLVTHQNQGRGELYTYVISTGELSQVETETGTITGAEVRPDGQLWYGWMSSSTPPQIRSGDQILLRPPGEPAPAGVRYRDDHGGDVHFFYATPGGEGPFPTLFQVHGGPTSHDRDAFSPRVQAWVDHGFAVVLVNYRGSTGYGSGWRDGIIGSPGFTELEDIAKAYERVQEIGFADPARTMISGASWGGYLTLLALGRQPDMWALGIADVPIGDYLVAYEDEMEPLKAYDRSLFGTSPEENPDLYRERSPITYIENVRVPVLILAGENDPRCPIRSVNLYIERLEELSKPHEVYRFDAGHGSLVVEETIKQVALEIDFASRHLGTTALL
jgi:acetyl esterase/lipase